MRRPVPREKRTSIGFLMKIFRIRADPKGGRRSRSENRLTYVAIAILFAVVLGFVFDRDLLKIYQMGGNLSGAMSGIFTLLMSITFAIISVYLVVHVLHPHFVKRPVPASLQKIIKEEKIREDMTRDELFDFVKELEQNDEEIKAYLDTARVKSDIAITLAAALMAFFVGMYGYMTSFTIVYESDPNLIIVSLCFMYIIFSNVYTILKTMSVVWDV